MKDEISVLTEIYFEFVLSLWKDSAEFNNFFELNVVYMCLILDYLIDYFYLDLANNQQYCLSEQDVFYPSEEIKRCLDEFEMFGSY